MKEMKRDSRWSLAQDREIVGGDCRFESASRQAARRPQLPPRLWKNYIYYNWSGVLELLE